MVSNFVVIRVMLALSLSLAPLTLWDTMSRVKRLSLGRLLSFLVPCGVLAADVAGVSCAWREVLCVSFFVVCFRELVRFGRFPFLPFELEFARYLGGRAGRVFRRKTRRWCLRRFGASTMALLLLVVGSLTPSLCLQHRDEACGVVQTREGGVTVLVTGSSMASLW